MNETDKPTPVILRAHQDFESRLKSWNNSDKSAKIAFELCTAVGRLWRLGEKGQSRIGDLPALLGAADYLASIDVPNRYNLATADALKTETPLSADEAIDLISWRDEIQVAYLALRKVLNPPTQDHSDFHRRLFALERKWIEADDELFEGTPWLFFDAVEWLEQQRREIGPLMEPEHFPWFFEIAEAARLAWRLPVPLEFGAVEKAQMLRINSVFASALKLKTTADTETVLAGLSDSLLAAESLPAEPAQLLNDLAENIAPMRLRPYHALPEFIAVLSWEMGIDVIFQDEDCNPLPQYEGARVRLGHRWERVINGIARFRHEDLKRLYWDLANLPQRLTIQLSDGSAVACRVLEDQ